MNWTVGPHSSSVYWRRRAVLVAPLLVLFFTAVSCLIGDGSDEARLAGVPASPSASTRQPETTLDRTPAGPATPSPQADAPGNTPPPGVVALPGASGASQSAPTGQRPNTTPPACADGDLSLAAVPSDGSIRIGEYPKLRLVVTNTSTRACRRDLSAAQQELVIQRGGRKVWSSDDCARDDPSPAPGVRTIVPGEKLTFFVKWGGVTSSPDCATGSPVSPGRYDLIARLGTLKTQPVPFTVTK